jgi:acyl carrier protein
MLSATEIRHRTVEHIIEVLADDGVVVSGVDGPDDLVAIGVSSMVYARLVMRLEADFGVEVFSGSEQPPDVRTVDDLVNFFSSAMGLSGGDREAAS